MIQLLETDYKDHIKQLPDKCMDLAIVDPPWYNGHEKRESYGNQLATPVSYIQDSEDWEIPGQDYFDELKRVSKHQIIFGINYYDIKNLGSGRIIWDKCNTGDFSDAEIAYCSLIDGVKLFPYMWNGMNQGLSIDNGRCMQGNKKLNEKRIHQNQKPVKLYDWLLREFAQPHYTVYDTHFGSASSAIAAHFFGCNFVGCEKNPERYKEAKQRFDTVTTDESPLFSMMGASNEQLEIKSPTS